MIEYCDTTHEFLEKYYTKDIQAIIYRVAPYLKKDEERYENCRSFVCRSLLQQERVEKFDDTLGCKFSTYLYNCIKSLTFTHLDESKRDKNFRDCDSLDRIIVKDSSLTLGEAVMDDSIDTTDTFLDISQAMKYLEEYDLYSNKRNLYLSDLLKIYISGGTDKEAAEISGMTTAGVGCTKLILRKILKQIESGAIHRMINVEKAYTPEREHFRGIRDRRMKREEIDESKDV